jgi:hypothetical protein
MIAEALERLFKVSVIENPIQRVASLSAVVESISPEDRSKVVIVLTEGALRGPVAARGVAAVLGG